MPLAIFLFSIDYDLVTEFKVSCGITGIRNLEFYPKLCPYHCPKPILRIYVRMHRNYVIFLCHLPTFKRVEC